MNITFNPTSVSANFRAAQYGDGCFTTMLFEENQIRLWPLHLNRLAEACEKLHLTGFDPVLLQTQIDSWLEEPQHRDVKKVLKILISAPVGGRGYCRADQNCLDVVVTSHPFPEHYLNWQKNGISVHLSTIQLSQNPQLAGIKHLNRLEQVLVKSDPAQIGGEVHDVLVCDTDGMVVEASAANVFWRIASQWFTPDLQMSGVSGMQRKHIMNCMAHNGINVAEVRSKPAILAAADEMFLCNCIMGLVPVKKLTLNREFNNIQSNSFTIHSDYFLQLRAALENAR